MFIVANTSPSTHPAGGKRQLSGVRQQRDTPIHPQPRHNQKTALGDVASGGFPVEGEKGKKKEWKGAMRA